MTKRTSFPIGEALANAVALQNAGRLAEAEVIYDKVLKLDRGNGDALNLKGLVAHHSGRHIEAIALFNQAAAALPLFADVFFNKGTVLSALGRNEEALSAYGQAIRVRSDHAGARLNTGQLLHAMGRTVEAIEAFREMARVCPSEARGFYNLGVCLEKLVAQTDPTKRQDIAAESLSAFSRALTLEPNNAEFHTALSSLQFHLGDYVPAIAHLKTAIRINPTWAAAWQNLGSQLEAIGDRDGALHAYDRALTLDPAHVPAIVNQGMTKLALGRFSEGWEGYLRRFESEDFRFIPRSWPWPLWNGEDLSNKSILIWSDQGVGDQILYAAMIPEIAARARLCVVECESRLVPLYRRSFPNLEIVPKEAQAVHALSSRTFDYQRSILDLGRWLRPAVGSFPNRRPVLCADPAYTATLRAGYQSKAPGQKLVGLSWRSVNPTVGPQKSLALADFMPVLRTSKLTFVNLQYGDVADEIADIRAQSGATVLHDPDIDSLKDMDRFAAQVGALDAVLTISNTTAHVAAVLGVPTCLYVPDGRKRLWYWLEEGDYSPWYRSIRLWRRPGVETITAIARTISVT